MKTNRDYCINKVFGSEGGYTNDPHDKGGPTNDGITLTDYRMYVNKKGTANDVKNMSKETAKQIYISKYWDAINADDLPSGVDYTCFDYGVLCGINRPIKALKKFKALSGTALINAINDERLSYLKSLEDWKYYGDGWANRTSRVRKDSISLSKGDITTGPAVGVGWTGIGFAISQFFHEHTTAIIIGTLISAILVGTLIHLYKNKGK